MYTHKKGGRYTVLTTCKTKVNGVWEDGVVYCGVETTPYGPYTRTLEDFTEPGRFVMDPLPENHHETKIIDCPGLPRDDCKTDV